MFKFVTSDADDFKHKRKASQRACNDCRKRKKRCVHAQTSDSLAATGEEAGVTPLPRGVSEIISEPASDSQTAYRPVSPDVVALRNSCSDADSRLTPVMMQDHQAVQPRNTTSDERLASAYTSSPQIQSALDSERDLDASHKQVVDDVDALGSRYIGDLNPEGILLAATRPARARNLSDYTSVGHWVADKRLERPHDIESSLPVIQPPASMFYGFSASIQQVLIPLLQKECLSMLPSAESVDALSSIYFERIHPLMPIIKKKDFDCMPLSDASRILLQQGMCLAASMNICAKRHLQLGDQQLEHKEFGARMCSVMKTSMELGLVTDRIVMIQALALMSLHPPGPNSAETSAWLCGRAIQHVQSIGLHMKSDTLDREDDYADSLLCCIWALDTMNAAYAGRPVLMHERDFGKTIQSCFARQGASFQVLLRITDLLNKVINLYRPTTCEGSLEWEADFPMFEAILAESDAYHIPPSHTGMFTWDPCAIKKLTM